jgi:hypothetical protein
MNVQISDARWSTQATSLGIEMAALQRSRPALATTLWNARIRQLPCLGGVWDARSAATRATTHGGLDDDAAVRQAVASLIRGSAS